MPKLIQDTAFSISRFCLQKYEGLLDEIKACHSDIENRITFKKYEDTTSANQLHFGAAEGHNQLQGQDLLIIGTPHKPEYMYKLWAFYLKADISGMSIAFGSKPIPKDCCVKSSYGASKANWNNALAGPGC